MKRLLCLTAGLWLVACADPASKPFPKEVTLTKEVLQDKIKGGWAGQTIGCTYGAPTEFKYTGTMIQEYVSLPWDKGIIKGWYENSPGLYDDVYMDLTFVEVFDRLGLDAPVDSFAMAFATAEYVLWHANQAARYNIVHGIMPPRSGHWIDNPHAEDIDYQIEADFAGLMSPGMPNAASEISDRIGHIMCYGDGWYGGVYVGAMYSLAFISDDIPWIVTEALKTIPEQSRFHQCMRDVIAWHKQFPGDWKRTWFECERKWDEDYGCPHGTFRTYNIDAVINCAYVLIGLLYGEGDFYRTIDIATRCGQDSDCNPATAAGILGTMIGYSHISDYWLDPLREVEDMPLAFTDISLNKTYEMGMRHALAMVERGGGTVEGDLVTIKCQQPVPVRYERAFEGLWPVGTGSIRKELKAATPVEARFTGTGVVVKGEVKCPDKNYVALLAFAIDGKPIETARIPADFRIRRQELCWYYQLPKGEHVLTLLWTNPRPDAILYAGDLLFYSDGPVPVVHR